MKPQMICHEGPRPENPTTVMARLRIRRKWTKTELARASSLRTSRIDHIERNTRTFLEERQAIATALDTDVAELFGEDGRALKLQGVRT